MPLRLDVRTSALAVGDAAVLLAVHPRWSAVGAGLARPQTWLESAGPDVALAALCGVLLWLAAVWIALGLLAGLGGRLPGVTGRACTRLARAVLPKVLLRIFLGSAGLGLLAAPSAHALSPGAPGGIRQVIASRTPAFAASLTGSPGVPSPSWPVTPATTTPTHAPTRIPAPTPPMSASPAPAHPRSHPPTSSTGRAHVHRGDSLWLVAARRLGPQAGAWDVAHYWPQIYAANRSVIGDDPSVIRPGQVLDLPAPTPESSR